MRPGIECMNKPGKTGMENCQLDVHSENGTMVQGECLASATTRDMAGGRERIEDTLDLTQRQVNTLKSDVVRLKDEQKDSEDLIAQLHQANEALCQRLDELQSRCDLLEEQTRRRKSIEPESYRHDAAVALLTLSDTPTEQENSESRCARCRDGGRQSLGDVYGLLLQYPLHDFCHVLGRRHGTILHGALHGTLLRSHAGGLSQDTPPAMDLRKRRISQTMDYYQSPSDSPPDSLCSDPLKPDETEAQDQLCSPLDLSFRHFGVGEEERIDHREMGMEGLSDGRAVFSEGEGRIGHHRGLPKMDEVTEGRMRISEGPDDYHVEPPPLHIDLSPAHHEADHRLQPRTVADEDGSFIAGVDGEDGPETSLTAKMASYSRRRKRGPKSWEFLMRLMADPRTNPSVIRWEDRDAATVRLIQPHYIAKLWGKRSGRADLTYDHFARALRYHYKKGQLIKVSERQLVYGCGAEALRFLNTLMHQNQLGGGVGGGVGNLAEGMDPLEPIEVAQDPYIAKDEVQYGQVSV